MNKVKLVISAIIILFVVDLSLVYIFVVNYSNIKTNGVNALENQQLIKDPVNFTLTIPSGEIMIIGDCIKKDK